MPKFRQLHTCLKLFSLIRIFFSWHSSELYSVESITNQLLRLYEITAATNLNINPLQRKTKTHGLVVITIIKMSRFHI